MNLKLLRHSMVDYPSGSALEYYKDVLYVIGDDVNYILCLDKEWKEIKRIKLFEYDGVRIPKPIKPDLECAAIVDDVLYAVGSGSRSPQRDIAYSVQLEEQIVKKINCISFYSLFRDKGLIKEMNIEGLTDCGDMLLFFNRANIKESNQLIVSDRKILQKQFPDRFKVMPVEIGSINNIQLGISGACYDEANDILFVTASAENTDNAYDDGEIEGSVIGIVRHAKQKLNDAELKIDETIELSSIDPVFSQQKIESICITKSSGKNFRCVLVADNDDGRSVLFEVEVAI